MLPEDELNSRSVGKN